MRCASSSVLWSCSSAGRSLSSLVMSVLIMAFPFIGTDQMGAYRGISTLRSGRCCRRTFAALAAEVGNGEHQRRSLERGAEVERRTDTPVALWKVRHHGEDRRAYRRGDHRHQAVQSADRSQCLALVALVGGA